MNYQFVIEKIKYFLQTKVGNKNAVIGISGGIDSALVLTLLCKSLNKENIIPIFLPYYYFDENKDKETANDMIDIIELCKNLDIKFDTKIITSLIYGFISLFPELNFDVNKGSLANLKSRIRMVVLYCISNLNNGIVVGTTNRSEYMTGYFTKYGDGGIDIEPILHLYKNDVYEIAKLFKEIPESIINKKPSARLFNGQTDEEELGISYKDLDKILLDGKIRTKNIDLTDIEIFVKNLIINSNHKREIPSLLARDFEDD